MLRQVFAFTLLLVIPYTLATSAAQCRHPERIREDHIHLCCKHPDGHNDITEACAKETGFKLPSANEEAPEDVTVEQLVRGLCFGKCVFEKFKFLKGPELNMEAVRTHYKEVHSADAEYEREMIAAFDHCHGASEEATVRFLNNPSIKAYGSEHCDPRPSVILSCVVHYFFHNCPKERWSHTQECQDILKFATKCKDVLLNM